MLKQMVETRSWKAARGLVQDRRCRVCREKDGTIEHLVAGCKILANGKYLSRHNRVLMIMAVAWAKEYKLVGGDMVWNKERWERGVVLKKKEENFCGISNSIYAKLQWREDLTWPSRTKQIKKYEFATWHALKNGEKLTKYRQLAYKFKERHPK